MLVASAGVLENEKGIVEDGDCFLKRDTVLALIVRCLQLIPEKRRSTVLEAPVHDDRQDIVMYLQSKYIKGNRRV